jgi:quercetin dioxygenase-like cupin family protein
MALLTKALLAAVVIFGARMVPLMAQERTASGHAETLLKSTSSWNGKAYTKYLTGQPQLTVLRVTIDANTALPWHYHPIPNAGYVLSGELTIVDKASGKKQTFKQGEAFAESVDDVHRGMAGTMPTTILLIYSGVAGTATSVPLNGGEKEY